MASGGQVDWTLAELLPREKKVASGAVRSKPVPLLDRTRFGCELSGTSTTSKSVDAIVDASTSPVVVMLTG